MRDYSLYIFDLDGTLYKEEAKEFNESSLFQKVKINSIVFFGKRLNLILEEAIELWDELFEKHNFDVYLGLNEAGISKKEYFNHVWNVDPSTYVSSDPKLQDILRGIKKKKAVLTGAPEVWANNALKQLGVAELFDGVWTRDEKHAKPEKEAYLQVTNYFRVPPESTLIIDNDLKYLAPAKELGMFTIFVGAESKWGHLTIQSIYELPDVLRYVGV